MQLLVFWWRNSGDGIESDQRICDDAKGILRDIAYSFASEVLDVMSGCDSI